MRLTTFGRFLGALCLAGSLLYVASGPASANPPRWAMNVTNLPPTVAVGSDMGYQVTISNNGPSNISQLFLVSKTHESPVYVATSQGTCADAGSGPLSCTFGALNAKRSVTVIVAYDTPFSDTGANGGPGDPGDPVFQANTTGLTFSDGGTSHGDTLTDSNETGTLFTDDPDFAGGFSLHGSEITTQGDLSDSNKQTTDVVPPLSDSPLVVTAEDGPAVAFTCKKICSKAFGEWSSVNVGNGHQFATFFPITLLLRASDAPNNLSQIKVAHVLDNGTTVELDQCTTNVLENCIVVTSVGTNVQIKAYVNQNGGIRGIR
jgi:Domain of unknown function DUF11